METSVRTLLTRIRDTNERISTIQKEVGSKIPNLEQRVRIKMAMSQLKNLSDKLEEIINGKIQKVKFKLTDVNNIETCYMATFLNLTRDEVEDVVSICSSLIPGSKYEILEIEEISTSIKECPL